MRTTLLLLALASAPALCVAADDAPAVIATAEGPIRGIEELGLTVYRGIPYAAPPVGSLRWRAPQASTPWEEVMVADSYGPSCPQAGRADRPGVLGATSEDCLTLNLWVPQAEEKLPVMVWIHGGAFVIGSSAWPWYDGTPLAEHGVIVVTLNYRLGRLGFFAHPALTAGQAEEPLGNYGLMDQIAALRWVQRNIGAFGGDPHNVTIFGESAGGASVNLLMTSPLTQGLFHKAISQSGGGHNFARRLDAPRPGLGPQTEASAESLGERFARDLGIEGDGAAEIVAALRALPLETIVPEDALGVRVSPMIDGRVVVDDVAARFESGRQHDVPFLLGANSFEGSLARTFGLSDGMIERLLGSFAARARQVYGAERDDGWPLQAYGDAAFVAPARFLAAQMGQKSSPAYLYFFSYVATARRGQVAGASHGADVPFVFATLDRLPGAAALTSDEDRAMAAAVSAYWTSFAKQGRPEAPGHPDWPPYGPEDAWLELGETITVRHQLRKPQLDLLQERFDSQREAQPATDRSP